MAITRPGTDHDSGSIKLRSVSKSPPDRDRPARPRDDTSVPFQRTDAEGRGEGGRQGGEKGTGVHCV